MPVVRFNYNYSAFLITALLMGCLVLGLLSVRLSKIQKVSESGMFDIEVLPEEFLEEPAEEPEELPAQEFKIETNRAYNEAEEYISRVENENQTLSKLTEGKLQQMDQALAGAEEKNGLNSAPVSKPEPSEEFSNSDAESEKQAVVKGSNRYTSISYQLVNRTDIRLPNPVYTCFSSGRVVINIEVDKHGKVKKYAYNKSASTTSDQCLIDAAETYAAMALFSADLSREKQLGSISFNFPGQ